MPYDPHDFEYVVQEAKSSLLWRDDHLGGFDTLLGMYVGSAFRKDLGSSAAENHMFEWMTLILPMIVQDNPRVKWKAKSGRHRSISEALEAAQNAWIIDQNFRATLISCGATFGMHSAAVLINRKQRCSISGDSRPSFTPMVTPLHPKCWAIDYAAPLDCLARHKIASYQTTAEELIREATADMQENPDAGWDLPALESLKSARSSDAITGARASSRRGFITVHEVWFKDVELPEAEGKGSGYNGTVYTLVSTGGWSDVDSQRQVRAPRPFFGPKTGPLVIFGAHPVPGDAYPMSPNTPLVEQIKSMAKQNDAIDRAISEYKRLFVTDSAALAKLVKEGKFDHVFQVAGFTKEQITEAEIGGITPQMLEGQKIFRERLDRLSGVYDAMRGATTGKPLATEIGVAQQSMGVRTSGAKGAFNDGVTDVLRAVGFQMAFDPDVESRLSRDYARKYGMSNPTMRGSIDEGGAIDVDEFAEISIEPLSMERTSQAGEQRNAQLALDTAMKFLAVGAQPDFKGLIDALGNTINYPNMSESVLGRGGLAPQMSMSPGAAAAVPAGAAA